MADHAGETRAQGDHNGHMALIAAVGERQAPLLIDDQGQGELTEGMTLLRIAAPLGEAGTTVAGREKGVGVGRIIDEELFPRGKRSRIRVSNSRWMGAKWCASNRCM